MLWIALHLPLLLLEAFAATTLATGPDAAAGQPLALIDNRRLVVSVNAAAEALGVKLGLKRATALALAPRIILGRADRVRDTAALEPVAHAALAFTPNVAVQPADEPDAAAHTVLLEVDASLRYFGGRDHLVQRLQAALQPLHHCIHTAIAPTAHGAALLARLHHRRHCLDIADMRQALDAVPVSLLGSVHEHRAVLQGMGLRTLADLRQLPRSGLARRFGPALLNELDRAFGSEADPRIPIVLPPVFDSRLELFARADTTEQVLQGASLLLARLVAWLAAQHAFVRRFTLLMQHEARRFGASDDMPRSTTLEIALAEPSRDSAHLLVLLRERLARLQLAAPTLDLGLKASDIVRQGAPNQELFPTAQHEREGLTQLIERLQARLGPEQVQRLKPVEDYRPECASRIETALGATAPRAAAPPGARTATIHRRPVWLLHEPERLPERRSRPLLGGEPLQLLSGPERIEAGWWDSGLAERDYFIAQTPAGALVWIYRARLPLSTRAGADGWFMQGRFG